MLAPEDKAAEYRREAAACLEVAERMSLESDKQRMLDMALRWLDLAEQADKLLTGKDYRRPE
ncbi:MAG TPA: hypothetical protein VFB45_26620 [Pseudolabrys sp.]|nr:hypothetical protein [Pseudolabrys sp.]